MVPKSVSFYTKYLLIIILFTIQLKRNVFIFYFSSIYWECVSMNILTRWEDNAFNCLHICTMYIVHVWCDGKNEKEKNVKTPFGLYQHYFFLPFFSNDSDKRVSLHFIYKLIFITWNSMVFIRKVSSFFSFFIFVAPKELRLLLWNKIRNIMKLLSRDGFLLPLSFETKNKKKLLHIIYFCFFVIGVKSIIEIIIAMSMLCSFSDISLFSNQTESFHYLSFYYYFEFSGDITESISYHILCFWLLYHTYLSFLLLLLSIHWALVRFDTNHMILAQNSEYNILLCV